ncbi:PD-(D/E)XK nuclease family protein [Clostridium butanoliproducens]|uniref:PD-(D/E)XK nuclease family protein n=1 Tax=Clostridium butanoliproducens TaxID=2991837 RepID=UPI0024B95B3D|nr:PD-(D/E)XK nuclease family protein [Clostridium butanoliproducens]
MKPNIFKYATSELSQDAVICWILEWANSEDKVMKDFSYDFIRKILDLCQYDFVDLNNLVEIKIKKQYNNIDVFACLYFKDGSMIPLIIEDKTYTSEHSDQLKRYYKFILDENKGNEKIAEPLGIYYKSGFIYDNEIRKVLKEGYKIFNRSMMISLMKLYIDKVESDIFKNYYDYLEDLELEEEQIKNIIEKNDMENKSKVLDTYEGQFIFMRKLFGNCHNGYIYNGSSFGRPWTHCNIVEDFKFKELCDGIFYRLDQRNDGYYLAIRQYLDYSKVDVCKEHLNETDKAKIIESKMERLERLKKCFERALDNMNLKVIDVLEKGKVSNRGAKESEIGVFFINEKNTFRKIIEFIPLFNEIFESEMEKEFNFILRV